MKKLISSAVVILGATFGGQANAHVHYSDMALGGTPYVNSVSDGFGWFDGTQATLGNSHKVRWFSFTLAEETNVNINVANLGAGEFNKSDAAGTAFVSTGDIDVGFSLYQNIFPSDATGQSAVFENATWDNDNDSNTAPIPTYPALVGNLGLFNSFADVTMGNSDGEIGTINYIAHMNDNGVGGAELLNVLLQAGTYSLAVGGATAGLTGTFAVQADVSAVPVPAAVWLFGTALMGMVGLGRRKQAAA